MSLLELDGVDAYYGQSHILRDLSMRVDEGEVCALLGRNGAGKTTTLRSIAGATPPEVRDGRITFKGEDIAGMAAEDVSILGLSLVPEERRVFSNLTVEENLHLADVVRNRSNTIGRRSRSSTRGCLPAAHRSSPAAGIVKENVDPSPVSESTQISPPWRSMICGQSARPIPVPPYSSRR
jgi:ABC-type branched-subunit amino acid transport system ATPase component